MLKQMVAVSTHYISYPRLRKLAAYNIPTLAVCGKKDNLVSPQNSLFLSRMLNARLLCFEDAGHGVNEQHAASVNAAIEALAKQARTAGSTSGREPARPGVHPWLAMAFVLALGAVGYRRLGEVEGRAALTAAVAMGGVVISTLV